jgi:DNA-binding MarR family transcriptional regulator
MLTPSQARLLRWLGKFSKELVDSWDVPRELSLPGLSEALGVVRSALHSPLNALMEGGLVEFRLAHVIGGGSRRRNVYHLTEAGRVELANLPEQEIEEAPTRKSSLKGEPPGLSELKGREEILEQLSQIKPISMTIVGIAGIGKTSLVRKLVEGLLKNKKNCRWVRANIYDDSSSLAARALDGQDAPEEPRAVANWLSEKCNNEVIIIDDLQDIHDRHLKGIIKMIEGLDKKGQQLILISRAPSPIEIGEIISIEEVSDDAAMEILGDDIDEQQRLGAVEHLGGHPLALHMWNPEQPLAGAHIRRFVENTVLTQLPDELLPMLDGIAVLPVPVKAEILGGDDGMETLDEHALMRWTEGGLVELQHLVRNVRRESWSQKESEKVHAIAAQRWAEVSGQQARLLELHMRINGADENLEEHLELHGEGLILHDSAAMATLIDDACKRWPEADSLRHLSVCIALDRGEASHAESEIKNMKNPPLELQARLSRQQGKVKEALTLVEQAMASISGLEKVKLQISEATRMIDDRLPDDEEMQSLENVEKMIQEINVKELQSDQRKKVLVALASLKHTIKLKMNDSKAATAIRKSLESTTSSEDPLIIDMKNREDIKFSGLICVESSNRLRALSLKLLSINNMDEKQRIDALQDVVLDEITSTRLGRRLAADLWTLRGIHQSSDRLICWREAIHLYTAAECPAAAKALTLRMHSLLR